MARSKLNALVRSLTLAASVGAPCLAAAADLLPPPPPPPPPPPIEVGGGWYLRGDVGASVYTRPRYTEAYDYTGYADANRSFGNEIGGGGFAGVGVGYQFTPFLRGDVTGEYRYSTGLRGSEYYKGPEFDNGLGSYGVNKSTSNFDSAVVLANAYFDLGTWYGITPFIGGGVGYAFNHISGYSTNQQFTSPTYAYDYGNPIYDCKCGQPYYNYAPVYDNNGNPVYNTNSGSKFYKSKTSGSFAWALHAGLAYDVSDALKIEVAYRYLNLGKAETGAGFVPCCTEALRPIKVKDIEAHDVKIGLRYYLGGLVAAPLPPLMPEPIPGPLVRKY
ncbi:MULTISPECIES: outer membrane protein [Methylobacterium]|jgi:opacity protein-like surface antigen|uniref:Opacity protein-like surface antigen n=3 Tax=Methylobacterium TaxID=407 RepID=A0AAJ1TTU2_9HYPH|nr:MULTISPECIES: outer membrane beta-barrel protein [Methylobacterium]KNY21236.1 porin [Methylobacterium sp. ARG-1]MCB4801674.1 outer membrane beta-barrel protein [Methylobacterium brachiatum]MDF2600333.1 porin [Methylobacterium brachiatum]MDH2311608.1 outer membrane beta-barrel protein [Methylobacterium brachiatum]MDQ0544794.1 opacity protein-like surface antigen [Methylobacterium brachiatum]